MHNRVFHFSRFRLSAHPRPSTVQITQEQDVYSLFSQRAFALAHSTLWKHDDATLVVTHSAKMSATTEVFSFRIKLCLWVWTPNVPVEPAATMAMKTIPIMLPRKCAQMTSNCHSVLIFAMEFSLLTYWARKTGTEIQAVFFKRDSALRLTSPSHKFSIFLGRLCPKKCP